MKLLKEFFILHRFYAKLLKESALMKLSYREVLAKVENYEVIRKCQCKDKSCATVYMQRDHDFMEELCEIMSFDKAFFILHFYQKGKVELEALESLDYPYVQEYISVFEKRMTLDYDEVYAQNIVDNFFKDLLDEDIQTIVIE